MAEAVAPASSANLGPGFDTLAIALEITCRVTAERADEWKVTHLGPHAPNPGEGDAVLLAGRAVAGDGHPLEMTVSNDIPLGRGLGSSAAAFVAGTGAALRAIGKEAVLDDVMRIAAELEGHNDNVAAAVYGGFVAAVGVGAQPLEVHSSLRLVVAVPSRRLPTRWARRALPEIVEHEVATRSIARVVALVEGFRTAEPRLFAAAAGDELHEAPRGGLFPEAEDIIFTARSAGALHACWSGAGPSILAVTDVDNTERVAAALSEALADDGEVLRPEIAQKGLR